MFYAQFVLSKKGPLAKIWLAAHWEKKLTKAQIVETNIQEAVDEIKQPRTKIALRTTGHLLVGVCKIHDRKAKYLLADANEAFLRIKMAFRPGALDALEVDPTVARNAITLPEVMDDFEAIGGIGDMEELDLSAHDPISQSRIDDITLRDDFVHTDSGMYGNDFGGMDSFGVDDGMGGGDDLADFGLNDEEVKTAMDIIKQDNQQRAMAREQTPMLEGLRAPGGAIFDEHEISDEHEIARRSAGHGVDNSLTHLRDISQIKDNDDMGGMDIDMGDLPGDPGPDDDIPLGATAVSENGERASIGPESSFALDPLENSERATRPVQRKKRRLIVDEAKNLSGEEMKHNMADYRDTLCPLDLAPPTRKLMRLKETSTVEQLFHMPGIPTKNKYLIKQYQSHLVNSSRPATGFFNSTLGMGSDMNDSIEQIHQDLGLDANIDETIMDGGHGDEFEEEFDIGPLPTGSPLPEYDGEFYAGHMDDGGAEMAGGEVVEEGEEEAHHDSPTEKKKKNTSRLDKTMDETEDGDEDNKLSKRTQHVLNTIATKLRSSEEGEILLTDLLNKGSTRKTAAQKFYQLLVLKKSQAIDVKQSSPYAEIHILPGVNLDATAVAAH